MIVVDTYNVLHVVGILPPDIAGVDVLGLIDLICRSRYRHQPVALICDGVPRPGQPMGRVGGVTVRYSAGRGRNLTADDVIIRAISKSSAPKRLTIVTADRVILREARRRRCRTLDSAAFLQHLADDYTDGPAQSAPGVDRSGPLSQTEVEQWIATFRITAADLQPPLPEAGVARVDDERVEHQEPLTPPTPPAPTVPRVLPSDLVSQAEALLGDADALELPDDLLARALEVADAPGESAPTPPGDEPNTEIATSAEPTPPPDDPAPSDEAMPKPTAKPVRRADLLPGAFIAEAAALVEKDAKEEIQRQEDARQAAAEQDDIQTPKPPKPDPLRAVLSEDLIDAAEALAGGTSAAVSDQSDPPAPDEAKRKPRAPTLPKHIIEDAERLLRELQDEEA